MSNTPPPITARCSQSKGGRSGAGGAMAGEWEAAAATVTLTAGALADRVAAEAGSNQLRATAGRK
jgi:hypothetical protein